MQGTLPKSPIFKNPALAHRDEKAGRQKEARLAAKHPLMALIKALKFVNMHIVWSRKIHEARSQPSNTPRTLPFKQFLV